MQPNQGAADVAKNLHKAANGYGLDYEQILLCLHAIPYHLLPDFLYTMSRIAEKSGFQALQGEPMQEICPNCGKPEELWNDCECNEPEDFGTRIMPR